MSRLDDRYRKIDDRTIVLSDNKVKINGRIVLDILNLTNEIALNKPIHKRTIPTINNKSTKLIMNNLSPVSLIFYEIFQQNL